MFKPDRGDAPEDSKKRHADRPEAPRRRPEGAAPGDSLFLYAVLIDEIEQIATLIDDLRKPSG